MEEGKAFREEGGLVCLVHLCTAFGPSRPPAYYMIGMDRPTWSSRLRTVCSGPPDSHFLNQCFTSIHCCSGLTPKIWHPIVLPSFHFLFLLFIWSAKCIILSNLGHISTLKKKCTSFQFCN